MSIESIYTRLVRAGLSPVGACAVMGNMQDESAMRSNNVQDGYGYTDEGYTAKVDSGQLNFVDSIGYGLCQWTYGPRKLNLLRFARERGVSVGDETMQVDFCIQELRTEYPALWLYLCDATGVAEAAERVCKEYERPAETQVNSKERAAYANQFYMSLGGLEVSELPECPPSVTGPVTEVQNCDPTILILQAVLIAHGYELEANGQKSPDFLLKLADFVRVLGA